MEIKWTISLKLISLFKSSLNLAIRKWRSHLWLTLYFCWIVPLWTNHPIVVPELASLFSASIHTVSTIWHIHPSLRVSFYPWLKVSLRGSVLSRICRQYQWHVLSLWKQSRGGSEDQTLDPDYLHSNHSFTHKIMMILTTPVIFEIK